jgi:hypothetical protein
MLHLLHLSQLSSLVWRSKNTCLDDERADIGPRDDVVDVGIRKAPGACTSGETSCHTLEQ